MTKSLMQFKISGQVDLVAPLELYKWKNTWNLKPTNKPRQCKWHTVAIIYFRGWRVAMRDCQAMLANIGTYCLIKHSLRHSPFNLGTVKKASNITMKQEIYQSEYAILHSLWLIPTSWYAMIGSAHTHHFHSIKRSLNTAIWGLFWCYQF